MTLKNRNDILLLSLWGTLKVYLYTLLIFFAVRLFFIYFYGESKVLLENKLDLLEALFLGWKYDSLVISYLLAPVILIQIFFSVF